MTDAFAQPMTQEQADELLDAWEDLDWKPADEQARHDAPFPHDTWAESRGER